MPPRNVIVTAAAGGVRLKSQTDAQKQKLNLGIHRMPLETERPR